MLFHRQSNFSPSFSFTSDTVLWVLAVLLDALVSNAAEYFFLELNDTLLQNTN